MSTRKTPRALDFFAGSGLVTVGLKGLFDVVWANDICRKKCAIYRANFGGEHLLEGSIENVDGNSLPKAELAWASFPCQDLSVAGNMGGLSNGTRSGLFWEWIRILREMSPQSRPPILCAENVVGFLIANEGKQFAAAYDAIRGLGYKAGALVLDAADFLPQSRPRSFLIAVREDWPVDQRLIAGAANHLYHPSSVTMAASAIHDSDWIWWHLPLIPKTKHPLLDVVEKNAPTNSEDKTKKLLSMLSAVNQRKLEDVAALRGFHVGTGYKRIRAEKGVRRQRLEVRFDGMAGCLRTPEGGSSRQIILLVKNGRIETRLLTVRETARLMGAPDSFLLPGSYNDGYRAMGDAVAVPVTHFLASNLLSPLSQPSKSSRVIKPEKVFALHDDQIVKKAG